MNWLFDNADLVYLLLGGIALGLVVAGWLTRRVKFFALALIPLALIGLFWLLTRLVVTDKQQIHNSVDAMADAVVAGDVDGLFNHVARDFRHKQMTRAQLAQFLKGAVAQHKITEVKIREFEVVDLSRPKRSAKANFKASVFDKESVLAVVFCIADFTLEDDRWKLQGIDFRNAANPEQPMPGAP